MITFHLVLLYAVNIDRPRTLYVCVSGLESALEVAVVCNSNWWHHSQNRSVTMFKLPKNKPEDEDFIKSAHNDPSWPHDLDKPCDWSKVSPWQKTWFKIGIFWVFAFCGAFILLIEFINAGEGTDEPS